MILEPAVRAMANLAEVRGEHFWSLVGRLSVVFGLPMAIPILAAFFWLGTLSTRVDGTEKQLGGLVQVVGGLVTLGAAHTENIRSNGVEIDRLQNQVDQLLRTRAPVPPQ